MSTREIIKELPKLTPEELKEVDAKLQELLQPSRVHKSWGEALLEIAGTAKGLPGDYAHQHDHYLYGTPKKR